MYISLHILSSMRYTYSILNPTICQSQAVWHMRVVHPSLQSRPKIDPCMDKGCTHSCVASGATSAKCKCPPGQGLHYDGVSCHGKTLGKAQDRDKRYQLSLDWALSVSVPILGTWKCMWSQSKEIWICQFPTRSCWLDTKMISNEF